MAKIVTPLSPSKINSAKPTDKLYKLYDGNGLALWVYPKGRKVWIFEYKKPSDKKKASITLRNSPRQLIPRIEC